MIPDPDKINNKAFNVNYQERWSSLTKNESSIKNLKKVYPSNYTLSKLGKHEDLSEEFLNEVPKVSHIVDSTIITDAVDKSDTTSKVLESENNTDASPLAKELPFFSSWFSRDSIHFLEKENFGDFFGEKPSKTPEVYLMIRNFIVDLYWSNPKVNLRLTTCRKFIRGDVNLLIRIFEFLEKWEIINCQSSKEVCKDFQKFSNFYFPKEKNLCTSQSNILSCQACRAKIINNYYELKNSTCVSKVDKISEYYICIECFNDDKYPIIYLKENFEQAKADQSKYPTKDYLLDSELGKRSQVLQEPEYQIKKTLEDKQLEFEIKAITNSLIEHPTSDKINNQEALFLKNKSSLKRIKEYSDEYLQDLSKRLEFLFSLSKLVRHESDMPT